MVFKLKDLGLATIGASLFTGLFTYPASAILLGNLVDGPTTTVSTPGGEFTFSNFAVIDWPGTPAVNAALSAFRAFDVTPTLSGSGDPILSFSSSTLTTTGDYTLDYQVTYTGSGTLPVNFISYAQGFCANPINCDGDTISTNIYESAANRSAGTGSLSFVSTDINQQDVSATISKSGGIPTAYARTNINVQSGGFTDFNGTYDAQAVPWETDVAPLVGATILFGGAMWWKRRRAASQIDLTGQGSEPGQE